MCTSAVTSSAPKDGGVQEHVNKMPVYSHDRTRTCWSGAGKSGHSIKTVKQGWRKLDAAQICQLLFARATLLLPQLG